MLGSTVDPSHSRRRSWLARLRWLALAGLLIGCPAFTCAPVDGTPCEDDFDCGDEQVCDALECATVQLCQTSADCPADEGCFQRMTVPAQHPFESGTEGKKFCDCINSTCEENGGGL